MTLSALLRILRDRWLYLVAGLLVGLVVAGLVCVLTPRTYSSTSTLYVSASGDSTNAQGAYEGSLLSQQRIKSYTELMVSDRVLGDVVTRLGLGESSADLARDVSVSSATESTIIGVTVSDRDPQRAARIADAIAARFVDVVGELEQPRRPNAAPPVTVSVIDQAVVADRPVSPQVNASLALGGVLGLVVGAAIALLRGALDTRIRKTSELAEASGSTVVGALPIVPSLVGATEAPPTDGAYGEAVRRLRTNLLFAAVDEPASTLAITSSLPAEGKTTLVCALAAALAQTSRVIVVEGDLRRPTIASRLGLSGSVGMTDVLTRRVALGDAVQRWRAPSPVDVLVCGTLPPNPNELLTSRHTRDLIAQLAQYYDYVLLDSPPLLPVADGAIVASYASCTILLTREGVTTRSQVEKSTEALRLVGARLFGTVLTMTSETAKSRPYGSYYGYGATAVPGPLGPPAVPTPVPTPVPTADPVPPARPAALTDAVPLAASPPSSASTVAPTEAHPGAHAEALTGAEAWFSKPVDRPSPVPRPAPEPDDTSTSSIPLGHQLNGTERS